MVAKQKLIDQYGHFFVLCTTHHQKDRNGFPDYTSRVLELGKHGWIGNLDSCWTPRQDVPMRYEIKEFLGDIPVAKHRGGVGVLNGLEGSDQKVSVFRTVEEAEAQLEKIRDKVAKMYEELRKIAKTRELSFSTDDPDIPMELDMLPEDVEFPHHDILRKGGEIFFVREDLQLFKLEVLRGKIERADLRAIETTNAHESTFTHTYGMEIHFSGGGDDYVVETLRMSDDKTGWDQVVNYNDYAQDDIAIFITHDGALAYARKLAASAYENIKDLLPQRGISVAGSTPACP